jgi:drug/metabolite transporter (DMT)-like permease
MKTIDEKGITQRDNFVGIGSAILSALLFGTSPVVAALAYAGGSNGMTMTFTRSLFSIPFLFLIAKAMKVSLRVRKRELITLFIVSVAGNFATTVMLYSSFQYIGIGLATVLHYLSPVIIMLINIVLFKEKAKSWKILSLFLAFVGMLTFFTRSGGTLFLGTLLALGSAVSYAIIFLSVEHTTLNTLHHVTLTFYTSLFVSIVSFIVGQASGLLNLRMTLSAWGYSVILALMVGVAAFALLNRAIVLVGSSTTSVISMLEPLTGIVVGSLILKESYSLTNWIGCALILLGAAIVSIFSLKSSKVSADKDEQAEPPPDRSRG